MKDILFKIFSPILQSFEKGEGSYTYRPSHRTILIVVGLLFLVLALVSVFFSIAGGQLGAILPILVFSTVGLVCVVVGSLGSDRAVAKIWGSK